MAFEFKGQHFSDEQQALIFKDCPRCKALGRECNKSLNEYPPYGKGKRRGLPFGSYCRLCCRELTAERYAARKAAGVKEVS